MNPEPLPLARDAQRHPLAGDDRREQDDQDTLQ